MIENEKAKYGLLSHLKQDIPASIVVLFVALPLCLGIALASGAPLFSGLIAGIIGGIVVGSISDSAHGVSGPAAGLAVVVFEALHSMSFEIFLLAVVIGGVLQIILGLARAGIIGYFFPSAAIKGMLSGIGIIIILKQIPHAFGYDKEWMGSESFIHLDGVNTFTIIGKVLLGHITPGAVLIAAISIVILLLWDLYLTKKYNIFTLIQGPIVVVAAAICCQFITKSYFPQYTLGSEHLVSVPIAGSISSFFDLFTFPDFSQLGNKEVYFLGVTLAIVASLETLLCVEATDKLDPHKRVTSTNRELFAQGTGNILSGMVGGLPITQVIVRSSANMQAGSRTKLSTILHGGLLLICVALLPRVLNLIPLSALACILIMIGYKLSKPSLFIQTYKLGLDQFLPFIVTVLGIIFVDLLVGLGLGCSVGTVVVLIRNYKNSHFLHMMKGDRERQLRMTLAEDVNFLNKGAIIKELARIPRGTYLTIDMSRCYSIDYDVREAIEDFIKSADGRDINVKLKQPLAETSGREEIYSKKLGKWVLALPVKNRVIPV
ncbi:MAG: SulP family inorganic anion transporter [Candidatus Scalindua sp. AMX11]|nr:MAG: SulP family inorganic anion transporter [Candidatus Scalindua sp.]NOG83384.1 SulP family inorganic anion transporter [Planctomycetota bacterium]RZV65546.1 MAG: SulP family inorganic anion transporter [Candidatus Scalindua sp. SCAELEC01]TDE63533.1 MAG: SulP family inorganic anion transporter [Candidatus Scalindua sp. AMX11]GJQ60589.1 MAG: membrane protein [Candidatus Scalindua sp.]